MSTSSSVPLFPSGVRSEELIPSQAGEPAGDKESYWQVVQHTLAGCQGTGGELVDWHHQWRRSSQRLVQLSAAARDMAEQRDAQQLAQVLAFHLAQLLHVDYSCVHFYSNDQPDTSAACRGSSLCEPQPYRSLDQLIRRALKEHRLVREHATAALAQDCLHEALVVPVMGMHRKVIATLAGANKKLEAPLGPEDIQAAVCLARMASAAVDRARLFQRLHEWSQSLEMLLSFNATVNQQLEPEQLVRQLLENATRFLKADGGLVGLAVEPSQGHPPAMQCVGHWQQGQWRSWQRRWGPEEGIPGFVLVSQFPYFANDYPNDPLADPELAARFGIRRSVCVPIKNCQEKVLGFFELHRREGEAEFTWLDAAFLESLGNTAAVAIENVRLLRSLEARNQEIKRLSAQYMHRLEEERRSISRELHDEAGQVLIGLKLGIQVLSGLLPAEARDAQEHLQRLRHQVNEAAARIKELATRLRPPALDELGFEAALHQLAAECRQRMGLIVDVHIQGNARVPSEAATSLFRIVQEALTNVSKHAGTNKARIHLTTGSQILLVISDQGKGFDPSQRGQGLGLLGIQERVKLLGGQLVVHSRPGAGTRLEVRIPNHAQDTHSVG